MFGPHLFMDASSSYRLGDIKYISNFLYLLPKIAEMTILDEPRVFKVSKIECSAGAGVTGSVIITESHITIHTFVEQEYFFVDIFSCKKFDDKKVKKFIKDYFLVRSSVDTLMMRGQYFNK